MTADGEGNKEVVEMSVPNEDTKRVEHPNVDEVRGAFENQEIQSDGVDKEVKDGQLQAVHAQGVLQLLPQQQSQGSSVVCWERFLHVRSIKVLLVENDDSTRHVVAALLRNCNYEVVEASNGVQAWKILEDLTNHIDLVLTEVVMPCLSGIGLLCKTMNHETRKNIPVIMMSSHDSMGLVFKCFSKGAVDFLVKPIRKNELKNLWQHVWRRCHSSSSSGSESAAQTQKSEKSNNIEKSDNHSGSNDAEDNRSTGLNVGDGSDDGSGTQSSWTKQAGEVDSSQALSPWEQLAERQDSTCAQVTDSHAGTSNNKWVPMTAAVECKDQEKQLENVAEVKELSTGKSRNLGQPRNLIEVPLKLGVANQLSVDGMNSQTNFQQVEKGLADAGGECLSGEHRAGNKSISQMDNGEDEAPKECAKIFYFDQANDYSRESPVLELSLKRHRGVKDSGEAVQDGRNILRRSELSAFSRYNTTTSAFKPLNGTAGSSSLHDNSLEVKKEFVCNVRSSSNGNNLHLSSNGINNNIDTGSTTNKVSTNPLVFKDLSEATSKINSMHPSSAFKTIRDDLRCTPQQVMLVKADDMAAAGALVTHRSSPQELQIQRIHHEQYYFCNLEQQQQLSNHDDLSLKTLTADDPLCGSSNVLGLSIEGNPGNYSLNRSASGSSNRQNGSSPAVNTGGMNVESGIGLTGKNGSGDASGSGSGNKTDQSKSAQREAALKKFRQKRSERCFSKKVRYQNRQRLAEQRPRVRGQFVKQSGQSNSNSAAEG